MVKFINSWAQGIIIAVIISTIIEIILPEGNNKKYVKTIIGIYILFVIIHPLLTKISNKSININSIITSTNSQISKYEINTLDSNSYIKETYKLKIEEDIENTVLQKGYKINSLNIIIETQNKEKYGQIKEILLNIEKVKEGKNYNNTINQISEIDINIKKRVEKNKENENITEEEIEKLKQILNTTYGTPIDKISIVK